MKLSIPEREKLALDLARAREGAGISQRRVAREAGKSAVWVGYVENCGGFPQPALLLTYARLCRLDGNALLLSWGYVPDSIREVLRRRPELCEAILQSA